MATYVLLHGGGEGGWHLLPRTSPTNLWPLCARRPGSARSKALKTSSVNGVTSDTLTRQLPGRRPLGIAITFVTPELDVSEDRTDGSPPHHRVRDDAHRS